MHVKAAVQVINCWQAVADPKQPVDRATILTLFLRIATLTMAIFTGLSVNAQSSSPDYHIDYAPIMSRGFGITDEPSMLDQCDSGYAGFRFFEHGAGRPLAMVRVEKIEDGARITKRTFKNDRASEIKQTRISETEWTELTDLMDQSGFWTFEMDETVWMPDSPTMWIEACLTSQFRSISIYPERVDLAVNAVNFLSDRTP